MANRQEAITAMREYIGLHPEDAATIKEELQDVLPADTQQPRQPDPTAGLERVMESLSISRSAKLRKYQKGENFSRFCERFRENISLTQMNAENQCTYFLQNVDDQTYSILKCVRLTQQQRNDSVQFCALFKKAIYGEESVSLKNEVRDCKQKSDEKIADYVYRLREKANIAYPDPENAEENCFLAFLRGINDVNIRRKLNEATITHFEQGVKLAKKLERVNKVFNEEADCSQILNTARVSFSDKSPDKDTNSRENASLDRSRPRDRGNRRDRNRSNHRSSSFESGDRSYSRSNRSPTPYPKDRSRETYPRHGDRDRSRETYPRYGDRDRSRETYPRFRNRDRSNSNSRGRYSRSNSRERRFNNDWRRSRSRERYPRSYRSSSNNRGYYRRDPNWAGRCFGCGEFGHYKSSCPNISYHSRAQDRVQCCSTTPSSTTDTQNNTNQQQQNFR